ncbi:DUF4403 family protein [Sinomicrobium sp.]
MKNNIRTNTLLSCLLICMLLAACSTTKKIETLKPEPDEAASTAYQNTHSFINLPVSIKLKDVERMTNSSFDGLIYEDDDFEEDDLKMKVWKEQKISITNENGKLKTVIPLKALIQYKFSARNFGLPLDDISDIYLNGTVTLISDIGLFNWEIRTNTSLKSLIWNEEPSTNIMGQKVAVTSLVNPAVALFRSAIEKSIDQAIRETLDFKPNVLDALQKISTPFQMSDTYESWMRIIPQELYITDASLKDQTIFFKMGMKCIMETVIGQQPPTVFDQETIALKPVTEIPESINVSIAVISSYKDASRVITKNFKGYEFGEGRRKISVEKVDIWHKEGKIIVALEVSGSVEGTIYLAGYPQYNRVTKEVYFDKLDYVLDTKNALLKSAQWLAGNYVLLQLQEKCRYSIASDIAEGKEMMGQYLHNYSPTKGVFVNGEIQDIELDRMQLATNAMIALVKLKGKVFVSIDGLE